MLFIETSIILQNVYSLYKEIYTYMHVLSGSHISFSIIFRNFENLSISSREKLFFFFHFFIRDYIIFYSTIASKHEHDG